MMTFCKKSWKRKKRNSKSKRKRIRKKNSLPKANSFPKPSPIQILTNQMPSSCNPRRRLQNKIKGFPALGPTKISRTNQWSTSKRRLKLKKSHRILTDSQRITRHKISNFNYPKSINLPTKIKSNPSKLWSKSEILHKTILENDPNCNLTVKKTQKRTLKMNFMTLCLKSLRPRRTESSSTTLSLRISLEKLTGWGKFKGTHIHKNCRRN